MSHKRFPQGNRMSYTNAGLVHNMSKTLKTLQACADDPPAPMHAPAPAHLSVRTYDRSCASHTRIIASPPALITNRSSELDTSALTTPTWPARGTQRRKVHATPEVHVTQVHMTAQGAYNAERCI